MPSYQLMSMDSPQSSSLQILLLPLSIVSGLRLRPNEKLTDTLLSDDNHDGALEEYIRTGQYALQMPNLPLISALKKCLNLILH